MPLLLSPDKGRPAVSRCAAQAGGILESFRDYLCRPPSLVNRALSDRLLFCRIPLRALNNLLNFTGSRTNGKICAILIIKGRNPRSPTRKNVPIEYTFACKRVPLNDSIKEYAQKKISKLERYFREDTTAFVTFSVEKDHLCSVEITIRGGATLLRAQTPDGNMRGAIDAAVGYIERQILKNKTRLASACG